MWSSSPYNTPTAVKISISMNPVSPQQREFPCVRKTWRGCDQSNIDDELKLVANNVNVNSGQVRIFAMPEYRKAVAKWPAAGQSFTKWPAVWYFSQILRNGLRNPFNYTHPWRDVVNFAAHFFFFFYAVVVELEQVQGCYQLGSRPLSDKILTTTSQGGEPWTTLLGEGRFGIASRPFGCDRSRLSFSLQYVY